MADAITNAKDDDTVLLLKQSTIDWKFDSTKKLTINLNWNDAKFSLNIKEWTISLTWQWNIEPAVWAVLRLYWLPEWDWVVANIWKDIVLKWGVYIFWNKYYESSAAAAAANSWKVELNLEWKINASTYWISVNWNITDKTKFPIINIKEWAEILVPWDSPAIYQAWYSDVNIATWVKVSWGRTAIEIRAWNLNVNWWEFISLSESYSFAWNPGWPTTYWAALAIAQHTTTNDITVDIKWGTFKWKKALSIINPQNNESPVPSIKITWWSFEWSDWALDNQAVYLGNLITKFIEWWTYSSEFDSGYVVDGKAIVNVADDTVTPYHVWDKVTVTFNANGWTTNPATKDIVKWEKVVKPANPIHSDSCNQFNTWIKDGVEFDFDTVIDSDITLTATWNYTCSRSSWGGGSSRSSSNNTMNEVVLWWEVEVNTWDKAEINTWDENELAENTDGNNWDRNDSNYDSELVDAYGWAYKNGITTMDTIEKARLKDWITRAELAKMMVVFMSWVLQKQLVITGNAGYDDVSEEKLGDLAWYIELAYQYQIMWINADGTPIQYFNPKGKVSRAEFATVLSRVLYGSINNQQWANYREKHIEALNKAGILTDTNPETQELRWWIILMLYRSQNSETNNVEENTAQVTTWDVAEVESGSAVEVATWTTAEIATGAVVEANTGSVAQTAIAETNTWDVAKVESGSTAEVATWDSK